MKKLIISVVLLVGAATPAFAKYSYSEYCANMHTVMAREEEALLRADPEMAHNFRYAMYELSETRAGTIGENRSDVNLFSDCLHDQFDSRSGAYMRWNAIKKEMTTNPCEDGQTFVYGSGCVSNDTAAILNALKRR